MMKWESSTAESQKIAEVGKKVIGLKCLFQPVGAGYVEV
jgi:hypothetical protein